MKILLMTQYFYPEPGATTNRMLSFARKFAEQGHEVTVLCEFPNYPTGIMPKEYRFRLYKTETFENFKIVRTYNWPTARTSVLSRLANYASYMISSLIMAIFMPKANVIVALSPPPSVGFSAGLVSRLRSIPLIGDIQDLWPEYAIATGKLKNKILIAICKFIELFFYRRCLALVTISDGLKEYLEKRTQGKTKIYLVANGSSVPDIPSLREKRADCFRGPVVNVCYAGVIGLLQPIEDIIEAARLTHDDSTIRYTIIGDGVKKKSLEKLIEAGNLSNIRFTGVLSQEETNDYLYKSDVSIVTLLDIEQFKSALPSKFFDYMAIGLPVILGVDGEARRILESNKTGLYYKPGCPEDLVAQIRWLQANPEDARAMGLAGQRLVCSSYSRSDLAYRMERIIAEQITAK